MSSWRLLLLVLSFAVLVKTVKRWALGASCSVAGSIYCCALFEMVCGLWANVLVHLRWASGGLSVIIVFMYVLFIFKKLYFSSGLLQYPYSVRLTHTQEKNETWLLLLIMIKPLKTMVTMVTPCELIGHFQFYLLMCSFQNGQGMS